MLALASDAVLTALVYTPRPSDSLGTAGGIFVIIASIVDILLIMFILLAFLGVAYQGSRMTDTGTREMFRTRGQIAVVQDEGH